MNDSCGIVRGLGWGMGVVVVDWSKSEGASAAVVVAGADFPKTKSDPVLAGSCLLVVPIFSNDNDGAGGFDVSVPPPIAVDPKENDVVGLTTAVAVVELFGDMAAGIAGKDKELLEVVAVVVFGGVKLMENPVPVLDGAE